MRALLIIIAAVCALWAIDVFANDGRYSKPLWQQAKLQGQQISKEVKGWMK